MIEFVRGKILAVQPGRVVVDVGPMGLGVDVPSSVAASAGTRLGAEIQLHTHLLVREDALQLVGFATDVQKQMFLSLTSVSGIGPKVALKLLGEIDPGELAAAIVRGDVARLTQLPGLGKKTAEVLVAHLRDAIAKGKVAGLKPGPRSSSLPAGMPTTVQGNEALLALQALGADPARARAALDKALAECPGIEGDTSRQVAESLRRL
ncbi:MAG TPA: Holliday junction branch migration protein RuvA [Fibrobacteria bacterium]|nr:Holliday junction branch migration protein RuvA [Fibrobacteria bacterium]